MDGKIINIWGCMYQGWREILAIFLWWIQFPPSPRVQEWFFPQSAVFINKVMNTCTNCGKELNNKNKYCSYKCRNIYVNKNLRDYSRNVNGRINKGKEQYLKNPKKCKHCGENIPYKKRVNIYCNNSCKASHTNRKQKGKKRNFSEQALRNLRKSALNIRGKNYVTVRERYIQNPTKFCENCNEPLEWKKRKNKYCSRNCRSQQERVGKEDYEIYYMDCQFKHNLADYPDEYDFSLIEQHGWYSAANRGNNLYGVSRDHIYSVRQGFHDGVPAEMISHPANCQLLLHSDNVRKNKHIDMTVEELQQRIDEWEDKYSQDDKKPSA